MAVQPGPRALEASAATLQEGGRLSVLDAEGPSSKPSSLDPSLCCPHHVLGSGGQPACPHVLPTAAREPPSPVARWQPLALSLGALRPPRSPGPLISSGVPSPAWGLHPLSPGRLSPPGTALSALSPSLRFCCHGFLA